MVHVRSFIPLCCLLALCVILFAQEPEQYAKSEKDATELGPKNKAFMEAFTEFRELNKKLTAMKVENQDASPNRRKEIEIEHPQLYKQGLELYKNVLTLALDAHDEAPNRNPSVNNLLYSTVAWEFNRENYEASFRVFKRLAASGIDKGAERYYVFAGFAALLSMNYEEAEKWLDIAEESGELEKKIKEWVQSSDSGKSLVQTLQGQFMTMSQTKEAWTKEQQIRKTETEAGEQDPAKKLPRVELLIGKESAAARGRIVLELFENEAPNSVANFISLVESGYYNGIVFHRVLPNFMAQGGRKGTDERSPGYTIDDECGNRFPQYRRHFRGSISMANAGPNTNGSQFFLTFVPTSFLDGRHTVFGRVVEGLEVLADIQRFDPSDENAKIPELDKIVEAKVLNKRNHAYQVKKNGNR